MVIADTVTQPDFSQASPAAAASHAGVGFSQPVLQTIYAILTSTSFTACHTFFMAFRPQLVHHNKSSVHINNDNDNPDCHLLICAAKPQQGEKLGLDFVLLDMLLRQLL